MAIIGITGGAGTGKSFVAKLAAENFDMLHIDTDKLARTQMMPGGASYTGVAENFPDCLVRKRTAGDTEGKTDVNTADSAAEDGAESAQLPEIDRAALAMKVFNDKELLEKLNSLTHPHVREAVEALIEASAGVFDHVLIETAILADAGYCPICDAVWFVSAPAADRKKRLKDRGYDEERTESVIASQPSDEKYRETSTYEIYNGEDADEEKIIGQIKAALKELGTKDKKSDDGDEKIQ
ncbi:MAG: dephospho-CoA kinase [Lachnospiraceae bacterium]|nr:dephospho-CoA kinase [Lachnospiraceae bacterium]